MSVRICFSKSRLFLPCLHSSRLFSTKPSAECSPIQANFIEFMNDRGIMYSPKVFIGEKNTENGKRRGLFAKERIQVNTCVGAIPFHSVFTKNTFLGENSMHAVLDPTLLSCILGIDQFDLKDPSKNEQFAVGTMLGNHNLRNLVQLSLLVLLSSLQPLSRFHNWIRHVGVPPILEEIYKSPSFSLDQAYMLKSREAMHADLLSPIRHGCNMSATDLESLIPSGKNNIFYQNLIKEAQGIQRDLRSICTHHPLIVEIVTRIAGKYFRNNTFAVRTLICDWAFAVVGSRAFGSSFKDLKTAADAGLPFKDPFIVPFFDLLNNPDDCTVSNNSNIIFEIVTAAELEEILAKNKVKSTLKSKKLKYQKKESKEENNIANDAVQSKPVETPNKDDSYALTNEVLEWMKDIGVTKARLERCRDGFLLMRTLKTIETDQELVYRYLKPPLNYDCNYAFSYGFVPAMAPNGFIQSE